MPFDPNQFIQQAGGQVQQGQPATPGGPSGGFDPDAFIAAHQSTTEPPSSQADLDSNTTSSPIKKAWAFMHRAVNAGTFGLSDWASAGLATAINTGLGYEDAGDFFGNIGKAHAQLMRNLQQEGAQNPKSAFLGDVVGSVVGFGKVAKAAKALGYVGKEASLLEKGALRANAANLAKVGAAAGATQAGLNTRELSDLPGNIAEGAAGGAVGGMVGGAAGLGLGKVATKAYGKVFDKLPGADSPRAVMATWKWAAKQLNLSLDDLTGIQRGAIRQHGKMYSPAQLLEFHNQGRLQQMAQEDKILGRQMRQAGETDLQNLRHEGRDILKSAMQEPNHMSLNDLMDKRASRFEAWINDHGSEEAILNGDGAGGLAEPEIVDAMKAMLSDRGLDKQLAGPLTKRVTAAWRNIEMGHEGRLTLSDVNDIRKALYRARKVVEPSGRMASADEYAKYSQWKELLDQQAGRTNKNYNTALVNYKNDSKYITGYQAGLSKAHPAHYPNDPFNDLKTPEGMKGWRQGRLVAGWHDSATPNGALQAAADIAHNLDTKELLLRGMSPAEFDNLQQRMNALLTRAQNLHGTMPHYVNERSQDMTSEVAHLAGSLGSHTPIGGVYHGFRASTLFAHSKVSPAMMKKLSALLDSRDEKQNIRGLILLRKLMARDRKVQSNAAGAGAYYGGSGVSNMLTGPSDE